MSKDFLFQGVYPALVTPMTDEEEIDYRILSVWARGLCAGAPVDGAVVVSEAGGSEQFGVYGERSG